jgi:hypothetical protein
MDPKGRGPATASLSIENFAALEWPLFAHLRSALVSASGGRYPPIAAVQVRRRVAVKGRNNCQLSCSIQRVSKAKGPTRKVLSFISSGAPLISSN